MPSSAASKPLSEAGAGINPAEFAWLRMGEAGGWFPRKTVEFSFQEAEEYKLVNKQQVSTKAQI